MSEQVPDVSKSVTVQASPEQAFKIFTERPLEWWPESHVFVTNRESITFEGRVGGRYFERGADGEEIAWGVITEWEPGKRLVMTWRVGPNWRPIFDDEKASFIEVDFTPQGEDTEVRLTHAQLHRHGEIAPFIHAALDGPSPGETLEKFAKVVAKHV